MLPSLHKRPLYNFLIYYSLLCFLCALLSLRTSLIPSGPLPSWAKQPAIHPYLPHLPPARHPTISHLTPLQKHNFLLTPSIPNLRTTSATPSNLLTLEKLTACISDPSRTCESTPAGVVVLLEADYFRRHLAGGNEGEDIWAKSMLDALVELGYSLVITAGRDETNKVYADLGGAVAAVIMTRDGMKECVDSSRGGRKGGCLESEQNPFGIPVWKILSMYFFPSEDSHPLGSKWILSPEPYHLSGLNSEARYIGYSIEDACLPLDVVPMDERENRAYILAKYQDYFTSSKATFTSDSFPLITDHISTPASPFSFVGGWTHRNDHDRLGHVEGVINLGRMGRDKFVQEMGKSRVLVGMGDPVISPTPYEALCLGVPFINPIKEWDTTQPENRNRWISQHNGLHELNAPHVYHIFKNDEHALAAAIQAALSTPIERTVLDRMHKSEVVKRVKQTIEGVDWWRKWRELGDEGRTRGLA